MTAATPPGAAPPAAPRGTGLLGNVVLSLASLAITVLLTFGVEHLIGKNLARRKAQTWAALGQPGLLLPYSRMRYVTGEFTCTTSANSLGLRGPELQDPKRDGVCRIAIIGDSYTFGWGVNDAEAWPRVLERRLQRDGVAVELANLGYPGTMPTDYAIVAERALAVLQPDLVLVVLTLGEDVAQEGVKTSITRLRELAVVADRAAPQREPRGLVSRILARAYPNLVQVTHRWRVGSVRETWQRMARLVLSTVNLAELRRYEQLDEDIKAQFLAGKLNPSLVAHALIEPTYYGHHLALDAPETQTVITYVGTQLKQIRESARAVGAPVLVVTVPFGAYVSPEAQAGLRREGFVLTEALLTSPAQDEAVRLAAEQAGLPFVSVTAAFRAADSAGFYYPLDAHFTPAGNAFYADALRPILADWVANLAPVAPDPEHAQPPVPKPTTNASGV